MNMDRPSTSGNDQFRSLQILDELSQNDSLTQRDLSGRLGIALGLVNSYIKNLAAKGYITVKTIPSKRYAYYLTPNGFAEKTRLTYSLLQDYTRIYREARKNYSLLFRDLERTGAKRVLFAGIDEVADFAYITLQETSLTLCGVVDCDKPGGLFFGHIIAPLNEAGNISADSIVITSYSKRNKIYPELIENGIDAKNIQMVFHDKQN